MKIRTNKTNILLMCIVALTTWMVSACDDDSMGGNTLQGFPTDTLFVVAAPGDTVDVSFSVGYDWRILSDKKWCTVGSADGEQNTYGKPGDNTVKFVISESGDKFVADTAEITLYMNSESRTIAFITCSPEEFKLKVKDGQREYVNGNTITIEETGKKVLYLESNFSLKGLKGKWPSQWLSYEFNDTSTVTLEVKEEFFRYSMNNVEDSLCLYNDRGLRQSFHVQYVGMNSREIRIDSKLEEALVVSQNGTSAQLGFEEMQLPVKFSVTAWNDKFKIIPLSENSVGEYEILTDAASWVKADTTKGVVQLSKIEENKGEDRMMHLLALPQGIIDDLVNAGDDLLSYLCEEVEEGVNFEQYRMVTILQEGVKYIIIDSEVHELDAQWNVKVAADGGGYSYARDTCYTSMKVGIDTYRGYKLICAHYNIVTNGYTFTDVADSWLDVEQKEKEVNISFGANEGHERTLYLFALPLTVLEEWEVIPSKIADYQEFLMEKLLEEIDEYLLDVSAGAEEYVVAKFIQEADDANSMKVFRTTPSRTEYFEVIKELPEEWAESLAKKNVPLDRVFRCSMTFGLSYIINPLIPLNLWDTGNEAGHARIEIYGKSGTKYESGEDNDYIEEHGMMEEVEGNYMLVTLTVVLNKITEDFVICFMDDNSECVKALVVNKK